ncbi:hypothetical protein XU18_2101 [Perkinsela sp. CCAP 1560/4]|nr:hypothetical protein XU18_2101 [Perkinsela sp. CCAP 1560/4]|eukprot:KNH07204.1 hypothetical protein XU18_2101 [Perkinsela sp. CCAP 1560/4]
MKADLVSGKNEIEGTSPYPEEVSSPYNFEEKSGGISEDNKPRCVEEAEMEIVMYLEYMGGKESIQKVEANVLWRERFERNCGNIRDFLSSRNIFAISGDNDCVTVLKNIIRKAALNKKTDSHSLGGVTNTPSGIAAALPIRKVGRTSIVSREKNRHKDVPLETAGKIAISCFCQGIDLEVMQRRFRQLDYSSDLSNKVLHVTNKLSHFSDSRKVSRSYAKNDRYGIHTPESHRKQWQEEAEQTAVQIEDTSNSHSCHEYGENDQANLQKFDLFVFSYGAVVWWGYSMQLYRTLEKEFNPTEHGQLPSCDSQYGNPIKEPCPKKYVKDLFPVWCTFEIVDRELVPDQRKYFETNQSLLSEGALKMLYSQDFPFSLPLYSNTAFLEALQRDHILLPVDLAAVKQAISHALAQSAKLDIIEPGVRDLLSICKPLPVQIKEKGYTNIKNRKVNQLKGQLFLLRMEIKSDSELFDEPEFFWEFPWFKQIFRIVRDDYGIESRISLLDEKLSAVQFTLDMIGNQFSEEHGRRLEWIIIVLILIEVFIAIAQLMLEMGYGIESK